MAEEATLNYEPIEPPDVSNIITEDDKPVDNIPSEKQQRLLVESLYSSWKIDRPFLAAANVGIFGSIKQPPIVPDIFLSLDVEIEKDWWAKEHRSYFIWEFGKPPEVVVEIVSNTYGGENSKKFKSYARLGVWYYVLYDPQLIIQKDTLRIYELLSGQYVAKIDRHLKWVGLSLAVWKGTFEGRNDFWLRWCDKDGQIMLTGIERADQERKRADQERKRADQEHKRADQERERADRLMAQLLANGINPDN